MVIGQRLSPTNSQAPGPLGAYYLRRPGGGVSIQWHRAGTKNVLLFINKPLSLFLPVADESHDEKENVLILGPMVDQNKPNHD